MDDFSQIIGFIIAIIFFIASAIRKNKKKNSAPKSNNKFTETLESFIGGNFEQNQETEVTFNEPELETEPVVQEKPTFVRSTKASLFKASKSSLSKDHEQKKATKYNKSRQRTKPPINLKQAIIYSEIINRKEF